MNTARAPLCLGVIGMSPGNGHPYSWSAICNGYRAGPMLDCGFPVIPAYLAEQDWPAAQLPDARVTHVWTQDAARSRHIADAARIANVVERPEGMLGQIDGLLLARDDAENHLRFARPFLDAGLPVFIDKPVALSRGALDALYDVARDETQIFSCTALRFAKELALSQDDRDQIGPLRSVIAQTPKLWATYAVHVIEPALAALAVGAAPKSVSAAALSDGGACLVARMDSGQDLIVTALGGKAAGDLWVDYVGETGHIRKTVHDTFSAFREALAAFTLQAGAGVPQTSYTALARVVDLIEAGCNAD